MMRLYPDTPYGGSRSGAIAVAVAKAIVLLTLVAVSILLIGRVLAAGTHLVNGIQQIQSGQAGVLEAISCAKSEPDNLASQRRDCLMLNGTDAAHPKQTTKIDPVSPSQAALRSMSGDIDIPAAAWASPTHGYEGFARFITTAQLSSTAAGQAGGSIA